MHGADIGHLYSQFVEKKQYHPWFGQLELTYRCNLECVHCYCKGSENKDKELTATQWKNILDGLKDEGCLFITFTGGEPLLREDFLDIYAYAKSNGFIVSIFTNGLGFNKNIINYLLKFPPNSIEITLNGITKEIYESITCVTGSFDQVMHNIQLLHKYKLPLIIKTNCLKQNKNEVVHIKQWADSFLGRSAKGEFYFKFDTIITPRLNGDNSPAKHRLSFEEIIEFKKQDPDMWAQYRKSLCERRADKRLHNERLYLCDSWQQQFFINPYGKLKFCQFSDKFSVDLKSIPFSEGFYNIFSDISNEKFKTDSKCRKCDLREVCCNCPARAYLETEDEEAPVDYYCRLAYAEHKETNGSK